MRCAVLGGGLAGLVCAMELARRGCRVTVIEAAPFAGGRASSWNSPSGLPVGTGLHVVADHYVNLLSELTSLGVLERLRWWKDHCYLTPGRPPALWGFNRLPAPFHLLRAARHMPLSIAERLRLLQASLDAGRYRQEDLAQLDDLPYLDWHRHHGLNDGFVLDLADFASDAATFMPAERVAARPVLSWLKYMSRTASAGRIGTWTAPLREALIEPLVGAITSLGGVVRTGTAAVGLLSESNEVRAVVTRASASEGPCYRADGDASPVGLQEELACDVVVAALPVQALRRLLTPYQAVEAHLEDALRLGTVPALSATIAFDRLIRPMPLGAALVSGCAIRDFIDLSTVWTGLRTSVLQFLVRGSEERMPLSDEEIARALVGDLASVWPQVRGARPVDLHVERIGAAMFASVPGAHRLRPAAGTGIPNLFLAGDWIRHDLNASMEGAVLSGKLAARAVLRGQESHQISILAPREAVVTRAIQALARPRRRGVRAAA